MIAEQVTLLIVTLNFFGFAESIFTPEMDLAVPLQPDVDDPTQ
jgi:hypothetical protein